MKSVINKAVVISGFMIFSGCASVQTQQPKYQTGSFPDLEVRTTVSVGQVMISKYNYLSQERAVLLGSVSGSKGSWLLLGAFRSKRNGLEVGDSLVLSTSSGEEVYCQEPAQKGAACLKDSDGDGHFERAYKMNAYGYLENGVDIPPVPYRVGDRAIKDGFKYELIYQGIDNGVVRIAYREYTENLARPAFSQDLTYTVTDMGDTHVRFRDVTAEIHSADNLQIEYTVNSGF